MRDLGLLKNNLHNNGIRNHHPADDPNGQDWRGFMFVHEALTKVEGEYEEHTMIITGNTLHTNLWRGMDVNDSTYTIYFHQYLLHDVYTEQLQMYIDSIGGIA